MYKFSKDTSSGTNRLYVQGTQGPTGPPIVTSITDNVNLEAKFTNKKLSTEVLGSSIESMQTSRPREDGTKRITTRIVRKVTTLTRGEEKSHSKGLNNRAQTKSIQYTVDVEDLGVIRPKKVKVFIKFIIFIKYMKVFKIDINIKLIFYCYSKKVNKLISSYKLKIT